MRTQYETLLLGADLFALGHAAAHNDALVLEPTELLGTDFPACLREGAPSAAPRHESAKRLFALLAEHEAVLGDGRVRMTAFSPLLYCYARDAALPVLLDARPVSLTRRADMWEVDVLSNAGLRTLTARTLLGSGAACLLSGIPACAEKILNVLCHGVPADFEARLRGEFGTARVRAGWRTGETVAAFPFEPETTLPQARARLTEGWKRCFPNGEALISTLAFAFEERFAAPGLRKVGDGAAYLPHGSFDDPIAAFDAGAACNLEGGAPIWA